jgi:uncharacterized damage-inducible protein DinB
MTDIARTFLDKSRHLLMSDYLPKLERCLEELSDEDVWWRPNEASNSIGNLMLHLTGNLREWIIGGVGQRAFERIRQQEFDERSHLPGKELLARLRATLKEADDVLASVGPESLLTRRQIQNDVGTVLEAIYHVVEHFAMHTGQIIMLSKMRAGKDLRLWQPFATRASTARASTHP